MSEGHRPDSTPTLTVEFPAATSSSDALDNLTDAEKEFLRSTLPTEEELMVSWALPLLARAAVERRVFIAAQILVLDGLYDDPSGWCARALELAAAARGAHDG